MQIRAGRQVQSKRPDGYPSGRTGGNEPFSDRVYFFSSAKATKPVSVTIFFPSAVLPRLMKS